MEAQILGSNPAVTCLFRYLGQASRQAEGPVSSQLTLSIILDRHNKDRAGNDLDTHQLHLPHFLLRQSRPSRLNKQLEVMVEGDIKSM